MEPNIIQPQQNQPDDQSANSFSVASNPTIQPSNYQQVAGARTGRRGIGSVIALLVAVLVFAGGYYANFAVASASQSNASAQAQAFVAALNSGDNAKAYAMASDGLHSQQSPSQFSTAMGDLKASKPIFSNQSVGFNGRQATYTVTEAGLPPSSDGSTGGTFSMVLVKSGLTGWKVDSVNVE